MKSSAEVRIDKKNLVHSVGFIKNWIRDKRHKITRAIKAMAGIFKHSPKKVPGHGH